MDKISAAIHSKDTGLRLGLDARLEAALSLLGFCETLADIGCDHGRLSCGMLQRGNCNRVIATDLSAPSLEKAKQLANHVGLSDSIDFRVGSGLSVLQEGEAEAIAILGMGGKLIADILDASPIPLMGAKHAVFQPMRGVEDLRSYLWNNGYRMDCDRVVADNGRLYQIFSVLPPDAVAGRDTFPNGFPEQFFTVGYRAFEQNDPLLARLVYRELTQCKKRFRQAMGTEGEERLMQKGRKLESLFRLLDLDTSSILPD